VSNTTLRSTHVVGLDVSINEGVDVEIEIIGGLDEETCRAIDNALTAANILDDYGVIAVVIPRTLRWDISYPHPNVEQLPIVLVNGHVVSMGRAARPEEIVDYALAGVNGRGISLIEFRRSVRRGLMIAEHV